MVAHGCVRGRATHYRVYRVLCEIRLEPSPAFCKILNSNPESQNKTNLTKLVQPAQGFWRIQLQLQCIAAST